MQFNPDGPRVETDEGKVRLFVEPDRRGAERYFRARVVRGREPIARHQRPVGQCGRDRFSGALEGNRAFDIAQARNPLRRIGRLAPGEARCRECKHQQEGMQLHGDSNVRPRTMNGG